MAQGTIRNGALLAAAALVAVLAGCSGSSGGSDGEAKPSAPRGSTTTTVAPDDDLKLNEIQVMGTHNSFHVEAPADEMAALTAMNPEQAKQRQYSHPDLTTQLGEQKIRQIELDVFADSEGGLYSTPALAASDAEQDPAMDEPGTKVLHEQDVDYHSVCPTLVACLEEVKTWSDANPDHVPVAINIQFKDGPLIFPVEGQAVPEKWTTEAMDGLDEEIRSVFDEDQIITPDDVRGDHETLNEAVLAKDWPTLGDSRGKVMFLMINPEPYRSIYLDGHEGLEGRILFTNAETGQPDAAYIGVDDPLKDGGVTIMDLVERGYLVRTRADADDVEVETGSTDRLRTALASGAQWISTDYPGPDGAKDEDSDYIAELPGFLAARCNPVTAPKTCVDAAVEP